MQRTLPVVLALVLLIAAAPLAAQVAEPVAGAPSLAEQIDVYLERVRAAVDAPAISAAVAHRGRIVYAGGRGYADVGNQVEATEHTVYNIGSVSKVNAVVGIMALVESGDVDLDAPIQTWVPSFPEKSPPITLRHILTHTSGIRHYRADDFSGTSTFSENRQPFETIDAALDIFQEDELEFPPGSYWSYSSYATNLLHAVVEKTTDQTFEEFLDERVWSRAGMLATAFDVPERIVRHRARGYRRQPRSGRLQHEPYGDLSYKYAGGGMISTVVDQVRLGVALNHGLLLAPGTLEQMYTPLADPPLAFRRGREPTPLAFGQALIWRVGADEQGRRYASHGGSVIGFRSALVNYVEEDLVVAVMINIASQPRAFAVELADFVRGLLAVEAGE